jgi:hypothetical protein
LIIKKKNMPHVIPVKIHYGHIVKRVKNHICQKLKTIMELFSRTIVNILQDSSKSKFYELRIFRTMNTYRF